MGKNSQLSGPPCPHCAVWEQQGVNATQAQLILPGAQADPTGCWRVAVPSLQPQEAPCTVPPTLLTAPSFMSPSGFDGYFFLISCHRGTITWGLWSYHQRTTPEQARPPESNFWSWTRGAQPPNTEGAMHPGAGPTTAGPCCPSAHTRPPSARSTHILANPPGLRLPAGPLRPRYISREVPFA